jgi:hypothetical protein
MKNLTAWFVILFMSATAAFAATDEREEDRVKEAGTVLKEILNIPDDIPKDLLWPWRDGVPGRRALPGQMGRPCDVRP